VLKTTCNCLKNRQNAFKQRRALYHSIYPQSIELTTQADFLPAFLTGFSSIFFSTLWHKKAPSAIGADAAQAFAHASEVEAIL
jgi:hypothetical protein